MFWFLFPRNRWRAGWLTAVLPLLFCSLLPAVEFTTNTYISADNFTYDFQDITVNDCKLTIDGYHQFRSLHLINNATLTHSLGGSNPHHKLQLLITEDLVIQSSSCINVDEKGYIDSSPGIGCSGSLNAGGAGHGNNGGRSAYNVCGGEAYNTWAEPWQWGSKGGSVNSTLGTLSGGNGGGVVFLNVGGTFVLDGRITANGQDGYYYFHPLYGDAGAGGGAGGSIFIITSTLIGSGCIHAHGGNAGKMDSGGGAGGRIMIYYQDRAEFSINNVRADGGLGYQNGGPGSVAWALKPSPDISGDDQADLDDFATISSLWQKNDCTGPDFCKGADLNMNHTVDLPDLLIFIADWLSETK